MATGTGDLAVELAGRVGPQGEVVGMDFSAAMLELARAKAPALRFEQGNALDLPYADGEFAASLCGFGVRNFSDLATGIAEMARVVKPGGKVVVLEITTPQRPPLSWFFKLWFDRIVPGLGRFAGDPDAYTYLPNSVRAVPRPRRARRRVRARRAHGRALGAHRRRDHRDPRRHGPRGAVTDGSAPAPLAAVLEAGGAELAGGLARTEARLVAIAEANGATLSEHASGTLNAGGKRLRPVLVFLCGGPDPEPLVPAAVAVELLHTATLVHDDVLDQAPLRRGNPTVYRHGRPPGGHRHRRLPLLAGVRRARRNRQRGRGGCAVGGLVGAGGR